MSRLYWANQNDGAVVVLGELKQPNHSTHTTQPHTDIAINYTHTQTHHTYIPHTHTSVSYIHTPTRTHYTHYTLHTTHYTLHTTHYTLHNTHYTHTHTPPQSLRISLPAWCNQPILPRQLSPPTHLTLLQPISLSSNPSHSPPTHLT